MGNHTFTLICRISAEALCVVASTIQLMIRSGVLVKHYSGLHTQGYVADNACQANMYIRDIMIDNEHDHL